MESGEQTKESIFESERLRPFLAFFCAAGWSLAYPLIKLGYKEMEIAGTDLGSKLLFAGVRFMTAGVIVLLLSLIQRRSFKPNQTRDWGWVLLFGLVNTTLHYMFSYIGLGYILSSRATLLDSMGGFFLVILGSIVFADDHFTKWKLLGCVLGFLGILLINIAPGQAMFSGISFQGDGMILLNAMCTAFGGLLTRVSSKKMDMTVATGISMGAGGAVLILIAACVGLDRPWKLTTAGMVNLFILILISAVCFGIYNQLIAHHPISKVAIYNAFIPVLGVMFASLILGEKFEFKYLAAGLIVAAGVAVTNMEHGR